MTPLDQAEAVLWTQRILGMGLLLQSVELFVTRGIYAPGGALAGRGNINLLLAGRGALSIWLLVAPCGVSTHLSALLMAVLLASSAWLVIRSRGETRPLEPGPLHDTPASLHGLEIGRVAEQLAQLA